MDRRVGITTTVPVEILFAAGMVPVDLNNIFIASPDPTYFIFRAERDGLPRTVCAWTKGIYEVAKTRGIRRIVGVVEGDCSSSRAILERWEKDGLDVIPIAYPFDRDPEKLGKEMERLADSFKASREKIASVREELDVIRGTVRYLDELTWNDGKVSGGENHLWQVSCSDFLGDISKFREALEAFIKKAEKRAERFNGIRVGYVGVPPIIGDLYSELERLGFFVVFNEIQRQFSMPGDGSDIVEQYLRYTYPYGTPGRLEDIRAEVKRRGIRGIIHYVQSFCHRGIEDYLIREDLGLPVLTLEADRPGSLDERSKTRLEAFAEMLKKR